MDLEFISLKKDGLPILIIILVTVGILTLGFSLSGDNSPNDAHVVKEVKKDIEELNTPTQELWILDVSHSIEKNKLTLTGITNLPQDSILQINIIRKYRDVGDYSEYFGEIVSQEVIVSNNEFTANIILNDAPWFSRVKELDALRNISFEWISDNIQTNIVFDPSYVSQPVEVKLKVGGKGEQLSGSLMDYSDDGQSKILRKSLEIEYPFSKTLKESLDYNLE